MKIGVSTESVSADAGTTGLLHAKMMPSVDSPVSPASSLT